LLTLRTAILVRRFGENWRHGSRHAELASILRYDEVLTRKSKEAFLPQMRFLEKKR
jgi:hypothetical protein